MSAPPKPASVSRLGALFLVAAALVALVPAASGAPPGASDPSPAQDGSPLSRAREIASPDSLQVFLLTFGQGDRVWERFGHNALWIHDGPAGTDRVYNWGIFDFQQEDFLVRLLTGHMRYRLAVFSLSGTLRQYRAANRAVYLQQLRLGPEQRRELQRRVQINYLPENRRYDYDPYLDNCSTRVRDHLDHVLDGELRAATGSVGTGRTWRSHTLRLLRRDFFPYLGLALGMGEPADEEITAWQEMFLPLRMRERVRSVRIDGGGGGSAALVSREDTLYRATRAPTPARAPERTPWFLLASLMAGGSMAWLGRRAGAGSNRSRRLFGGLGAAWSLLTGVVGTLMLAGWTLTDHWFLYRNENLLQANPIFLVLAALVAMAARAGGGRRVRRAARILAWCLVGLSAAGVLLQVLPGLDQVNGLAVALFLPIHLGLALGLREKDD